MSAEGVTGPHKPFLHHLKAYGCHCYVLIKSAGDPDCPKKLRKLQPRAHIGFLVGYCGGGSGATVKDCLFLVWGLIVAV